MGAVFLVMYAEVCYCRSAAHWLRKKQEVNRARACCTDENNEGSRGLNGVAKGCGGEWHIMPIAFATRRVNAGTRLPSTSKTQVPALQPLLRSGAPKRGGTPPAAFTTLASSRSSL